MHPSFIKKHITPTHFSEEGTTPTKPPEVRIEQLPHLLFDTRQQEKSGVQSTTPTTTVKYSADFSTDPDYLEMESLGQGGYGTVNHAIDLRTTPNSHVAIKKVVKESKRNEELEVLRYLAYARRERLSMDDGTAATERLWMTTLVDDFVWEKQQHLVFPMCAGGNVLEAQSWNPDFFADEANLKLFARSLAESLVLLHGSCVAHLDLKLENLLYEHEIDWTRHQVVISDFGFATFQSKILSFQGTLGNVAPEMIKEELARIQFEKQQRQKEFKKEARRGRGDHDPRREQHHTEQPAPLVGVAGRAFDSKCDMFSYGAIVAQLRCGRNPFGSETRQLIDNTLNVEKLMGRMNGMVDCRRFPIDQGLVTASPLLKDFLSRLLASDPDKRMTASEVLKHEWLQE